MANVLEKAKLTLPLEADSFKAFETRVARSLQSSRTEIYIDTSFLMWMVTIGEGAREQLIAWLEETCGPRLRIPVWSAHEFYRHQVSNTLPDGLDAQIKALEQSVTSVYTLAWPLLDEAGVVGGGQERQHELSEILRAVPRAASLARAAAKSYAGNARALTPFINAHALTGSQVPSYFEALDAIADARFTGRIPPGFMDKKKKARKEETEGEEYEVGSNRWGDLVFWREILSDAKRRQAKQVVLLTRDAKPDWRATCSLPVAPSNDGGPGAPQPHPFLRFEAAIEAGVEDVLLVDQRHLADVAKFLSPEKTKAFVFVARAPSLPEPKSEKEQRDEEGRRRDAVEQQVRTNLAKANGVNFLDPGHLSVSPPVLKRGSLMSRSGTNPSDAVLQWEADYEPAALLRGLSEAALSPLQSTDLIVLGRRISERATETGESSAAIVDLVSELSRLPAKTAGLFYYGLLLDTFQDPLANSTRPAPRGPALQMLYDLQKEPWALPAVKALVEALRKAEETPLYVPDPMGLRQALAVRQYQDREPRCQLRSVSFNGFELLVEDQFEETLRVRSLLQQEPATAEALLRIAAKTYGLPEGLIDIDKDFEGAYRVDELLGFKSPSSVWISSEEKHQ